jgi:hypothetical protein
MSPSGQLSRDFCGLALQMRGAIRAELGNDLWLEGNEWTTQKGLASTTLLFDAETAQKSPARAII